ncbi:MAG: type II secretion system F family protein [Tissierellia bacterium]|nr:type II secretion system F family protein [Tissierellia bacterium]
MKFTYRGVDEQGKVIDGHTDKSSKEEVIEYLYSLNIKPIEINKDRDLSFRFKKKRTPLSWGIVAEQLGILLSSGLHLKDILPLMKEEYKKTEFHDVFSTLEEDFKNGKSMYQSFKNYNDIPQSLLQGIYIGEYSAELEKNLSSIGRFLRKEAIEKAQLKNILIYPILLCCITIFMVGFLVGFVLPVFEELYITSGVHLPKSTILLLNTGKFFKRFGIWILLFIITFILLVKKLSSTKKYGEFFIDKGLKLPFIGKYLSYLYIRTLSGNLYILLQSGIELIPALKIFQETNTNPWMQNNLEKVIHSIEGGNTLSSALKERSIFPNVFLTFIRSGEESSSLENTLEYIFEYYTKELELIREKYLKNLEPVFIVVLGIFVGFIVLSIASPMFDLVLLF